MNLRSQLAYQVHYRLLGNLYLAYQRRRGEWRHRRRARAGGAAADNLAPPLYSAWRMRELISRQYLEGNYVNGVRKVAWVASGAPVEFLLALGYYVHYPENHAALCGTRGWMVELAGGAEQQGYSRDLCSYVRTDLGAALAGRSGVGRLPRPDLLLCCTNICQTVLNWYQVLAAHYRVPLIVIDTPFLYEGEQTHQHDYVYRQLQEAIPVAERVAGRSLSFPRLKEVTRLGKEGSELWQEILDRARHKPAPLNAFDAFINMGPIVAQRGQPATVRFYRSLLAEVDRRIADGVGAVRNESRRVLWDNLPIWPRLGWLARALARHGVSMVISNYAYAWGELAPLIDPERPLESGARVYMRTLLNRPAGDKLASMERMVHDFDLQGVILHSDRSCKPYSIGQVDQQQRLSAELSVPALLLEADHNDPRVFSDAQAENRLQAFVEMMA